MVFVDKLGLTSYDRTSKLLHAIYFLVPSYHHFLGNNSQEPRLEDYYSYHVHIRYEVYQHHIQYALLQKSF